MLTVAKDRRRALVTERTVESVSSLDFSQLGAGSASNTATEPRRIFAALPSKDPKYAYPRDVQTDVWEQWHERRAESDLVIKMNRPGFSGDSVH